MREVRNLSLLPARRRRLPKRALGGRETIQWDVRIHPDGSLTERTTGLDVAYLFWEALTNHAILVPPPPPPRLPCPRPASACIVLTRHLDLSPADSVLLAVTKITPYSTPRAGARARRS
ncbi:hypothetical protein C8R44DRAFT_896416 [Mycena epipterygia]|nr:hypothetical protein C8R44DRAFT_896416 [Mycena epipterygia]